MSSKVIIFFLIAFLLTSQTVKSEDSGNVPYFTDDDLLRYQTPSTTTERSYPDEEANRALKTPDNDKVKSTRTYKIKYTPYEGLTKRIIVSATFNDTYTAPAAIDTGAGVVLISLRLAEKLGLMSYDEGKVLWQASGIGGTTKALITILDSVSIGKARVEFVPVFIIDALSERFEALIGMDFLSNYSVYIDSSSSYLVLTELPHKKDFPAGHDKHWWISNFKRFKYYKDYWYKIMKSLEKQPDTPELIRLKAKVKKQFQEAERLFYKLNNYAIQNNVPQSWREY